MIIKILGCGTSTGVPIPGCTCAVCHSKHPRNQRLRSSALLVNGDQQLLIDTSPDLRQQALRAGINHLEAVVFTHPHSDHILGFDDLRVFNFRHPEPIPCFTLRDHYTRIYRIFDYIIDQDASYEGGMLAKVAFTKFDPGVPFQAAGVTLLPFLLQHGQQNAVVGYRIGSLAYATDCNGIPASSKQALQGVRTLILDGLGWESTPTHFSIPAALEVAAELGVERCILTHMTHTVDYQETSANLPDWACLAWDGMEIDF